MAKDPAFNFYTNDFDSKTKFFTHEQVGMYLRLLMAQHQHGHLTKDQMIFICGRYDKDVFLKFTEDSEGKFFNERLEDEVKKRQNYSESRKQNRNSKKENISKSYVKTHDSHMSQHMEIENEIENENFKYEIEKAEKKVKKIEAKIDIVYPFVTDRFINAWSLWLDHRKVIKKPYRSILSQQTALKKLSEYDEDTAIKMINQSIENDWQGLFELKDQKNGTSKKSESVNARREAFARRHGTSPDN